MANFRDYIKERNILTEEQFKKATEDSTKQRSSTFYSSLTSLGYLSEDVVVHEACQFFGYREIKNPFETKIDFDRTLKFMSIDRIIKDRMFVVTVTNEDDEPEQVVVIPNPEIDAYRTAATTGLGEEPKFALITSAQYEVFAQYQIKPKQNQIQSSEIDKEAASTRDKQRANALRDIESTAAQKLLDSLIECAIDRRASDLHIRAMGYGRNARVDLRVDGSMQHYTDIQGSALENLRNLLKTKCKVGGEQPDAPVEGQIIVNHNGKEVDTRVNIVRAVGGYDFVLRFITSNIRSLPDLGLSETNLRIVRQMFNWTKGLVLVCGPVGSGKTTLLYAGLAEMLAKDRVIFTLEDPVEITVPGIVQNNVSKEKGMTYQKKFPSSLRHDPDIILIGEIREGEVAANAIQASNTGHLVLSTIHANDAVGAISRLENIGVEPYALGEVLSGVIAQRLVRRICPDCKEEYDLPLDHRWRDKFDLGYGPLKLWRGRGCAKCAGTGYYDRICINEIITVSGEVRDAVQTHAPRSVIETALVKEHFKSYVDDGVEKALMGITTLDEIETYKDDNQQSIQSAKAAGPHLPTWADPTLQ